MSRSFAVAGTAVGHMLHIEHAGIFCGTEGIVSILKPPGKMLPGKALTMTHVVIPEVEVLQDHD